jgi:hypothetical protein
MVNELPGAALVRVTCTEGQVDFSSTTAPLSHSERLDVTTLRSRDRPLVAPFFLLMSISWE